MGGPILCHWFLVIPPEIMKKNRFYLFLGGRGYRKRPVAWNGLMGGFLIDRAEFICQFVGSLILSLRKTFVKLLFIVCNGLSLPHKISKQEISALIFRLTSFNPTSWIWAHVHTHQNRVKYKRLCTIWYHFYNFKNV